MNKPLALGCALAATVGIILAQEPGSQRPSEPVLKRASSPAEWTVDFHWDRQKLQESLGENGLKSDDGDTPDGTEAPKALTVSKVGSTYREVIRWGHGRTTEKWIVEGLEVYESPRSGRIARSVLPAFQYADNYSDYNRSDFEELEWVGLDNFKGLKSVGGRMVFEFSVEPSKRRLTPREKTELINPDETQSTAGIQQKLNEQSVGRSAYTAYLDTRTQLPLYFDNGLTIRIYKYSNNPPRNLVIPPDFAAELEAWKQEISRRGPLPPP